MLNIFGLFDIFDIICHNGLGYTMIIERIEISKLINDPNNARKHDKKNIMAIKGSLTKFGQQKPIVVNAKNIVIAGNGTMQAALELGWDKIDIVRSELDGFDATAYALADNRTSELAAWDDDALNATLAALQSVDFDLPAIGFDAKDWENPKDENEGLTDPDDVPEVDENPYNVQTGDIWQLGNHRLMCGDSTKTDDVEKLMDGQNADMVFTDPPYGIGGPNSREAHWHRSNSAAGYKNYKKFSDDETDATNCVESIISFNSDIKLIWGANHFTHLIPMSHNWIVWHKRRDGDKDRNSDCELAICFGLNKCSVRIFQHEWKGMIKESERGNSRLHPTQKPICLAEWCFENYGNPKTVVDLFLGSGSALIACEKTGRICYGMEIDQHYCSVIIKRWEDFTGKKAIKK